MPKINRTALIVASLLAILASVAVPASVAVFETLGVADTVGQIESRNERIATTRTLMNQLSDIQQGYQAMLLDVDIEPEERARIDAAIRELAKIDSPLSRLISISAPIIGAEEQIEMWQTAEAAVHSWEEVSRERTTSLAKDEKTFHFLQLRDSIRKIQDVAQRLDESFSRTNKTNTASALASLNSSATMLFIVIISGLTIAASSLGFLIIVFRTIRRAEQELRRSEATLAAQNVRFKTALEYMRHGLSMFDANNRLEVINRRYCEIYGLDANDVKIGMSVGEMQALHNDRGFKYSIGESGDFGSLFDPEPLAVADGVDTNELPSEDERVVEVNGRFIRVTRTRRTGGGWVVMHVDITEQRRAQNSLEAREEELTLHNQRFKDLVEGLPHALSMFDSKRRLVICNRPYVDFYGLTPERAAVGTPFAEIVDDILKRGILRGVTADDDEKFLSGLDGSQPTTAIYEFTDGRFLLMSRFPRAGGGWVAFHEDISRRIWAEREREAALLEAAQSREQERAAEAMSRAKSAFLAMTSHEIRTPMNAVVGLSAALLDTELDGEQRHVASTIHESSNVLLHLLNDILDISKLDAGKAEFETAPFAIASLIDHVTSIVSPRASEKGLSVRTTVADDIPEALIGDLGRLRQVVLNLASNAVKFTEAGVVEISARCLDQSGDLATIEIAVRDTGIGIAPQQIGKLFNEFAQADVAINRKYGGTGLGLAISRKILVQMGGDIRVESILGVGSTFYVTLALPITGADALARLLNSRGEPLRVLLAEDNATNQLVFSKLARGLNIDIVVAVNGHEAVELASQRSFDVVFMDMRMPEMDGLAATRAIRAIDGPRARVPIVALTANAFADDVKACRDAGMDDFLAKPLRRVVLFEKLANLLIRNGALLPMSNDGRRGDTATLEMRPDLPVTPPSEVAMADVAPILDRAAFAGLIAEIDIEGMRATLDVFAADTSGRLALLRRLSCERERDKIRDEAHTLKGAAGTFGMLQLAELARTLEQCAQVVSPRDCRDLIDRIDAGFKLARAELEAALAVAAAAA
jgi:signal transduction histidine kinase/CheY-like chemotaxis protein